MTENLDLAAGRQKAQCARTKLRGPAKSSVALQNLGKKNQIWRRRRETKKYVCLGPQKAQWAHKKLSEPAQSSEGPQNPQWPSKNVSL